MSVPDVSDLAKARALPADIADGSVPMALVSGRETAKRIATAQLGSAQAGLPSDIDSERELLAAILWSASYGASRLTVDAVSDLLDRVEMFHLPAHRVIWQACAALAVQKTPTTPVAVHSEVVRIRMERTSTDLDYLETLVQEAKPTSEPLARKYAQSIRDAWVRRELVAVAQTINDEARKGKLSSDDATTSALSLVSGVASAAVQADKSFIKLSKALGDMVRELQTPAGESVLTGYRDIDEETGGLFFRETSILAARTSVGKSALACQWAQRISENSDDKIAVFYVSLEMRAALFAGRLAAARARIEARRIRRKTLNREELAALFRASSEIGHLQLYFVDNQIQTLESIHASAKALRKSLATKGVRLGLIVIDHMGLVKPSTPSANRKRNEQVGETSRGLRFLATEHDCHVLGIAQINRDAAKRKGADAIPQVHELKDCGSLEEDTDNVFILHRERTAKGTFVSNAPADFVIAKARNDRTAHLQLGLDEEFVQFTDWNGPP